MIIKFSRIILKNAYDDADVDKMFVVIVANGTARKELHTSIYNMIGTLSEYDLGEKA